MAKKTAFVLTQTEILAYAIRGMLPNASKIAKLIKGAEMKTQDMFSEAYAEDIMKFEKLLELYELQTGNKYELAAVDEDAYDFFMKEG